MLKKYIYIKFFKHNQIQALTSTTLFVLTWKVGYCSQERSLFHKKNTKISEYSSWLSGNDGTPETNDIIMYT